MTTTTTRLWKVARGRTIDGCYFFWLINPQPDSDHHILDYRIIPVHEFWATQTVQEPTC
jgi:hypothetical protein